MTHTTESGRGDGAGRPADISADAALQSLLHGLGGSYAATATPDGTIGSVTSRVRRRRAAKQVGVGATACVLAGGVALGGVHLRGGGEPVAIPAASAPSETSADSAADDVESGRPPTFLAGTDALCGAAISDFGPSHGIVVRVGTVEIDQGRRAPTVDLRVTGDAWLPADARLGVAWVDEQDRVVAWEKPLTEELGHHSSGYVLGLDVGTDRTCAGLGAASGQAPSDRLVAYAIVDGKAVAGDPVEVRVDSDGTTVLTVANAEADVQAKAAAEARAAAKAAAQARAAARAAADASSAAEPKG